MEREERLKRQREFLIQAAYWAVIGMIGIFLLKTIGGVVFPFVLAFLLAWGLSFPIDFVTERVHARRGLVAVLVVFLFYGGLALLLYLLGSRMVAVAERCVGELGCFFQNTVLPFAESVNSRIGELLGENAGDVYVAASKTGNMTAGVSAKVFDGMSEAAVLLPGVCMKLFLTLIATILIELEFPDICKFIARQIPKHLRHGAKQLQRYVLGTIFKCALSYGLIFLLTLAELTAGLFLLRVEGAGLLALFIAVLDIFPVLGTGTVLLPWAVVASASGNLPFGLGLLFLYLVITVVRNIAEPRLVGRQMGLSPVVTLVSMVVGLHFLGIIGMLVLPLAAAFLKLLNDSGVIHLFCTEKEEKDGKTGDV